MKVLRTLLLLMVMGIGLTIGVGGQGVTPATGVNGAGQVFGNALYGMTSLQLGVNGGTGTFTISNSGDDILASNQYRISWAGGGLIGMPKIGRVVGATGAQAAIVQYTTIGADGDYEVSANVNVTAATTATIATTVTYTDETNTSRTDTFLFEQNGTTALVGSITNVTGVGAYAGVPLVIRVKASTQITIATSGTFTSVTYNVGGSIMQKGQ